MATLGVKPDGTPFTLEDLFSGTNQAERTEEVLMAYGKVNVSNQLATYAVMTVKPPFKRESAANTGIRIKGADHFANVSDWEGNGGLSICKVRHAPNTVILLQASWKRNGASLRDAVVFVRLRASGPLLNVVAFLPQARESRLGDRVVMFTGRGDIMDAEELRVLGIEVPHRFQDSYMNAEEIAECFEVTEVVSEAVPRPVIARVATGDGKVHLTEMPVAPRRRLRVRR